MKNIVSKQIKITNIFSKNFSTFVNPLISAKDAINKLNNSAEKTVFLDVRDPVEYQKSHIPGAQNVNEIFTYLSMSDSKGKEELKNYFENIFREKGINGNENIITYEASLNTRFGASCRGYYLLTLFGHKNVNVLDGGWENWLVHNGPTTNEVSLTDKGTFTAEWNLEGYVDKDEVLEIIKNQPKDTILLDVRDLDEWKGESSSPYGPDFVPRKGRLPGAKHLLWKNFMEKRDDGCIYLKDNEIICKQLEEEGITKDKNIVVYCFKGARASNTYIALKNAGYNVKNYFASWNEWSRDQNLLIDSKKI